MYPAKRTGPLAPDGRVARLEGRGGFSLWSPERSPYGRSRGSARKISLAGELRPLSCYAFAKRWLLPQHCIMIFQPCLDHIILNYRYLSNPDLKGNSK